MSRACSCSSRPEGAGPDFVRDMYESIVEERRLPADVPQAPRQDARRHLQRRLGVRQRRRHRLPPAPVGTAAPRAGPRPARARLAAARHPARPAPAAVGGEPRRGPRRRPVCDLHQDPPLAARRCLRSAPHGPLDDPGPRRRRDSRAVDARPEARDARAGPVAVGAAVDHRRGGIRCRAGSFDACRWPGPR